LPSDGPCDYSSSRPEEKWRSVQVAVLLFKGNSALPVESLSATRPAHRPVHPLPRLVHPRPACRIT
jgi:hypothetical protein